MKHCRSAILICLLTIFCRSNASSADSEGKSVRSYRKFEQSESGATDHGENASEQLFLNTGLKKKWKDTNSKLENSIFKSKVEVLGEIFRSRVNILKTNSKVELVFLVDSSSSVGEENFKSELKFVQKLIADFTVSPFDTRVAVVTFATSVETYVNHLDDKEHEKCSLLHSELPAIKYSGGNTFTLGAMLEAQKILNNSRIEAQRALFLITDGFSNNGYPVPVAEDLKEEGVIIFTFGIKSGNVEELYKMSSEPEEEHSFLLESFAEFEALARRALHQDLKSGSYMPLNDSNLCNDLCTFRNDTSSEENVCCNKQARCSCGTLTGHFVCLCPPGFYGSGLTGEECLPCPNGTYSDGTVPGDVLVCQPCPDSNQVLIKYPGTSKKDCKCADGFVAVGDKCQVVTCPKLSPPTNGYFVKKSCSKVLHAACGVRCNIGYELSGSSIRLCQKNGTWSGTPPVCMAKSCEKLKPVANSEMICTNEDEAFELAVRYDLNGNITKQSIKQINSDNVTSSAAVKKDKFLSKMMKWNVDFNYTIDTECKFFCSVGFSLVGSKTRTCLPVTRWGGLQTTCKAITCPSLPPLTNGYLFPENCTTPGIRHQYGTLCSISCKEGFLLKGPSEKNCTGKYGTWTGKNTPNKCIDIEPPKFDCPENVTLSTDEGSSFTTVNWSLPEATDNSGSKPLLWSKPSFNEDYPLKLNVGITLVYINGMDSSDNIKLCTFQVEVKDTEPPKVSNCESPPTFYLSSLSPEKPEIVWEEPEFTDNVDDSINVTKSHSFGVFPMGMTSLTYIALDSAQNKAECLINITVLDNPCSERPLLSNAEWNCTSSLNVTLCTLSCPLGFILVSPNGFDSENFTMTCTHDNKTAFWNPDYFEGDLDLFPDCSAVETPKQASQVEGIVLEGEPEACLDLDRLSKQVEGEVNSILGNENNDVKSEVSVLSKCEEEEKSIAEEATNVIHRRKKRNQASKKIHVDVSLIEDASKYPSREHIFTGLKKSGDKIRDHYSTKKLMKWNGRKVKVKAVETKQEPAFICKNGTVPKGARCVNCPRGTFYNSNLLTCDPCSTGEYQDEEGRVKCKRCPDGYSTRKPHSKSLTDCKVICPPGSFGKRYRRNHLALFPCTLCYLGYYQPLEGQSACLQCPPNEITGSKGSTNRNQCVEIKYLVDPCSLSPCKNNGTCVSEYGYPVCLCLDGFFGTFCEITLNPCDSSPCYNGKCLNVNSTNYICDCITGYGGKNCQTEINECESMPCANGGECVDVLNVYVCDCLPGFTGPNCLENVNECEKSHPCQNNGLCLDLTNGGYNCSCSEEFSGSHCEHRIECDLDQNGKCESNEDSEPLKKNSCDSIVCPFNMECHSSNGGSRCVCLKGFKGTNCTEGINPHVILSFPHWGVKEYLIVDFPLIDIDQISVCLWVKTTDNFNYGTLFSYANYENDNVFTLTDYNGFVLYVHKKRVITDITANDGLWHFVCVTWKSTKGEWHIYLDGLDKGGGFGLSENSPIPGGGKMVIGQEQDRFGGGFNEVESFVGKITYLDVWKRVLQGTEIKKFYTDCNFYEGDFISWLRFLGNMHGNIQVSDSDFCRDCSAALSLFRGNVVMEKNEESTNARYECDEGFFIKFDHRDERENDLNRIYHRKCLKHGDWEPNPPKCGVSCGFPGYFPHGTITGNSYLYSDVINYRCQPGYTLKGDSTRTCRPDGVWSGEKPYCQGDLTYCSPLLAPRHGSMFVYFNHEKSHDLRSAAIGDIMEFTCDKGFRLQGSKLLTCLAGGQWDHEIPFCSEMKCPYPDGISTIRNFTREEEYSVGEILIVKCNASFLERKIVCKANGKWNLTSNICEVYCFEKPKQPEHGYLLDDGRSEPAYNLGELVFFSCRNGYRLIGDNFFNCSEDGSWKQKRRGICQAVECGQPIRLPNADILPNKSYYYGDEIIYECLPGFQKYGDLLIRCEAEARWSRIRGHCIRITCKEPNVKEGMKILGNSYLFRDVLLIECPTNTKTAGNASNFITCQANGEWTQLPACT